MPSQLSSGRNADLLRRVFLHQNGLAVATALATLEASGVIGRLRKEPLRYGEVLSDTASPGAMAASMLTASAAGWLAIDESGGTVSLVPSEHLDFGRDLLVDVHRATCERDRGGSWSAGAAAERLLDCVEYVAAAKDAIQRRTSLPNQTGDTLARLVEGVVAAPLLPRIETCDKTAGDEALAALDFGTTASDLRRVRSFFAPMYGLAGSYGQALIGLPDRVVAGDPVTPRDINRLIDRAINVHASGMAHRGYFQVASRLVARLFEDQPPAEQPRAILDIGCGDGSWLRELYQLIARSTRRGQCLQRYPLHLIGVDLDPVSLETSARNLADLPATFVQGDVGQPEAIAEAVSSACGYDLDQVVSVRAFVDHNRSLSSAAAEAPDELRLSDGVFATPAGAPVSAAAVGRDWAAHYAGWREVCGRHGLVVIEAHTLTPAEACSRLDQSHNVALQYYHALSGQSPVRHAAFGAAARQAGLSTSEEIRYPEASPTTSITWFTSTDKESHA